MSCWALIALKSFACGKSRLAQVLSPAEREVFSRKMFEHVVQALQAAREVDGIAIVTPESSAVPAVALALSDPGGGLNAALASGAKRLAALGANELLMRGGWLMVGLAAVIGVIAVIGIAINPNIFFSFFAGFHSLFFEGDSWLFLYSDTLIRLFPIRFWQDA